MHMSTEAEHPMLVEKSMRIGTYDIDVMGIVSNIVYVRWFEDLRGVFLDCHWPYENMLRHNQSAVLSTTHLEYKTPLTIYDRPTGRMWVSGLGRMKWSLSFEINTPDRVHCVGYQTGCFFDLARQKPILTPQELRDEFESSLTSNCLKKSYEVIGHAGHI